MQDRSPVSNRTTPDQQAGARVPANRQLPEPAEGLAGRIIDEMSALVQDATALVELRVKKAQLELEERLEEKANTVVAQAAFAVMAALGGLFLLIALSLGLGDWLGHPAWGFLVVGLALVVIGFVVKKARPDVVRVGKDEVGVSREKLIAHPTAEPAYPPADPAVHEPARTAS